MNDDVTKQTDHTDHDDRAPEPIDSLPERPITESDAQTVKGGAGAIQRADEGPEERIALVYGKLAVSYLKQ